MLVIQEMLEKLPLAACSVLRTTAVPAGSHLQKPGFSEKAGLLFD